MPLEETHVAFFVPVIKIRIRTRRQCRRVLQDKIMKSNVHQFPLAKEAINQPSITPEAKVLTGHLDEAERLRIELGVEGNAELLWNRYIPQAIASKQISESTINSWSSLCASQVKPVLSEKEGLIWDSLVTIAIEEGRFKQLHSDVWKEFCVVRAIMDESRYHLNTTTWTYETDGRNGKQQKSKPEVAQLNETIRQWHWLVVQLGLGSKSENELNRSGATQMELDWEKFI